MTLRQEVTELTQALVRLDTVNPPGSETKAAELLRDYLAASGIESRLLARDPARANLVARLPGGDGPSLILICHTDTVLADPREWRRTRAWIPRPRWRGRAISSTARCGVAARST